MHDPLTKLERRILDFVVDYLRRNTYQPSVREIGDRFAIKSTKTVTEHLQSLADKGWIERDGSRSRGLRLLTVNLRPNVVTVPCYTIPDDVPVAGEPSSAAAPEAAEQYELDRRLAGGNGCFSLRMRDDSMDGAGIRDGDLVLIEAVANAGVRSGDVVAVRVAGQVTIRGYERRGTTIVLEPASTEYPSLVASPDRDMTILGRATGVFRRLGSAGGARERRKRGPGEPPRAAGASA